MAALASGRCGLTDGSKAGDWRLPTKDEWQATTRCAVELGCTTGGCHGPPSLTNNEGSTSGAGSQGCMNSGGYSSFTGVASGNDWTSSAYELVPDFAWFVNLGSDAFAFNFKDLTMRLWPVRSASR